MYYTLGIQQADGTGYFGSVLMNELLLIYRLGFLGDGDLNELRGFGELILEKEDSGAQNFREREPGNENYVSVHLFFVLVSTTITIMMMNLFVGILSTNYDECSGKARALFVRSRAHAVALYHCRYSMLYHLRDALPERLRWLIPIDHTDEGYSYVFFLHGGVARQAGQIMEGSCSAVPKPTCAGK